MDNPYIFPLSLITFLPALGALVLAFFPRDAKGAIRWLTLIVTVLVFIATVYIAIPRPEGATTSQFDLQADAARQMQDLFSVPWISSFNINYLMGLDGISFPLVILTSLVSMLAMGASWNIEKHVKAYCILFLLLETGMIGVFLALDFFLFYVFWEVMLLPMYFLIGVWGGPRKEYAAIKFFLYTLVGSVLMLIAILMLYFNSDLKLLEDQQLLDSKAVEVTAAEVAAAGGQTADELLQAKIAAIRADKNPTHTFNLLALAAIGQHEQSPFNVEILWGKSLQWWAFVLLFIGFAIKVPAVPVHTWLPDAHVEAPTPISMILAGILLKMGGYGILRICYPICPQAGYELAGVVCGIGVLSMVYGAFAALAQKDFKRLVAYSSVSHMGYVLLGLGVWSAAAPAYNSQYWAMGISGAMFQMIAHGISSAGMFFMVGVIYDRVHHRNLNEFGGLFHKMPLYSGMAFGIFFAGLGLPGLCGFSGEVLVTLSVWNYSQVLAVISAAVVILTAGYILWTLQRVYLGAEYRGPHGEHLHPMTGRELAIAAPLLAFAVLFGVNPQLVFQYTTPTIDHQAQTLTNLTPGFEKLAADRATTSQPAANRVAKILPPPPHPTNTEQ
ncbi:MAG: NADH-quinone oxidoreductase subunit M [Pirellulales bacterium]|nr:NADH-quinone oxidoreductase subunit M [Pirellulales bacterium]